MNVKFSVTRALKETGDNPRGILQLKIVSRQEVSDFGRTSLFQLPANRKRDFLSDSANGILPPFLATPSNELKNKKISARKKTNTFQKPLESLAPGCMDSQETDSLW